MSRRRLEPDHNPDDLSVPDRRQRPRLAPNARRVPVISHLESRSSWLQGEWSEHFRDPLNRENFFMRRDPPLIYRRSMPIRFELIPEILDGEYLHLHGNGVDEAIDLSHDTAPEGEEP